MSEVAELRDALAYMAKALQIIDSTGEALDVGAHLDLAINRLHELLEMREPFHQEMQTTARH